MSQTCIPAEMRRLVAGGAHRRCEYRLIREDDRYFGCEVDQVVGEKHGGPTVVENLAYACLACNRNEGSDLGSILVAGGDLIRFFHPRTDVWSDHFSPDGVVVKPLTAIGQVTERIFRFDAIERLMEREALRAIGRYPIGADVQGAWIGEWGSVPPRPIWGGHRSGVAGTDAGAETAGLRRGRGSRGVPGRPGFEGWKLHQFWARISWSGGPVVRLGGRSRSSPADPETG